MHALFSKQKSLVISTKNVVKSGCRCQHWRKCNVYKYERLFGSSSSRWISSPSRYVSGVVRASSGACVTVQCNVAPNPLKCDAQVNNAVSGRIGMLLNHARPGNYIENRLIISRQLYVSSHWRLPNKEPSKPSSKVEETVQALKEDLKEIEKKKAAAVDQIKVKKSWKQWIVDEVMHYYHGFRLLFIDVNISRKLLWRVLKGKTLTRREHKQLVRTVGDVFRLVPFSVFIIIPFMELLLPFAIKFFPGMLPSTFQTATEKEDKMKQSLKVKLEMAKFLQVTLDEMAVESKGRMSEGVKEFMDFVTRLRSSGQPPSNEEIIRFSKLFEDELTLDSLTRPQLVALCRVLELQPLGTVAFLRFQLRMRLRNLAADDKVIAKEGLESLTPWELQQACRARGMRAYGVSEAGLRAQLAQWLDLSLNRKVPPSLLLLSRALLLPDTVPASDQLKATLSVLPDTLVTHAKAAIGEREGKIDNKTRLELIKEEEKRIKEELLEETEELQRQTEREVKEVLLDKAPVLTDETSHILAFKELLSEEKKKEELTTEDLEMLEDALDSLAKEKKNLIVEKEELGSLKEELEDYKEDLVDLEQLVQAGDRLDKVRETKAARRLYNKVSKMIGKMDAVLGELGREERKMADVRQVTAELQEKKSDDLITIEEMLSAIRHIQSSSDNSLVQRISEVLEKMDLDKDGAIRVDHMLKVLEAVGNENVKLDRKQLDELLEVLKKEEVLELEDQIARALEKQSGRKDLEKRRATEEQGEQAGGREQAARAPERARDQEEGERKAEAPAATPANAAMAATQQPKPPAATIDGPAEGKGGSKTL
ncbi:mitochondrial proton/calcium exchanger protein [Bacillus rossius redtenbacheri]|uniref:mitochondrial proton/calcium exchanger protein n=1 Tax=Bacillus rossius redtenbacheri TaxID=93214 RepID=UPI002FDE2824